MAEPLEDPLLLVSGKDLVETRRAALQGYFKPGFPATGLPDSDTYSKGYCDPSVFRILDSDSYPPRGVPKLLYVSGIEAGPSSQQRQPDPNAALRWSPEGKFSSSALGVAQLQARVRFLEAHLQTHLPYLQLYKFGGVSLLVAAVSLIAWVITGIGVPFHPAFAAMVRQYGRNFDRTENE